ncbi:LysM peptidoglycan-binding domain-containing protein [Paenibacillus roseipurpureus]|uniref:LysM peptidoglycan-binding domain-containing protein n=1 Tax=Paenibacillus roseopurpureus TaxID=2918901 RepID=A0AA96LTL9_9BACL|nr:LysM peptidoglycan-binding domain-containing protein [Paenibacillus sp. MBLB1832]WNR45834.1 LysM peptidoglycan-binding domain-containing protein [Paenibacillus sp. MBLB1832]
MSEQQPGLRFDIYERVHLHENLAAIHELSDVELLPHIQVLTLDDQAILKGNLLLTGNYVSEEGDSTRSLEHFIPVEITLPLNRIHRVEDIQVEIENFDVDLLSARSLNVTGVLSLQGVEMVSSPQESWREEEEVTFVHQLDYPRSEPVQPAPIPAPPPYVTQLPVEQPPPYATQLPVEQPLPEAPPISQVPPTPIPSPIPVPTPIPPGPIASTPPETPKDGGVVAIDVEQIELKVTPHADSTVVTEEKKELKVAFGKKAADAVEVNPYGIKSLLSKAGSYLSDKRIAEAEAQAALEAESRIDAVEWKRLFLQSRSESQEFKKVKMCIVQKEETLDSIAKKYALTTRELQLMNRLSDQDVTAGQVIYLPR